MTVKTNKRRGARTETIAAEWLSTRYGWPVERIRLAGTADRGDLTGVPGLMVEVKSSNLERPPWAEWVRQSYRQADTIGTEHWSILYRPPRTPAPAGWLVIAPLATIGQLRRPLPAAFDRGPWHQRHRAQTQLAQHLGHIGPVVIIHPPELGCVGAPIFFDQWQQSQ